MVVAYAIFILFGGSRLRHLMRGMHDGIHNFKGGMRQDEVWQFSDGRQRQLNEAPETNKSWIVWVMVSSAALMLMTARSEEIISAEQMMIALGVLLAWSVAWWFGFGRNRKR